MMPSVRLSIALVTVVVVVGGFALCATAEYYSHEVSDDETMDDGGRPPAGSDGGFELPAHFYAHK